MNNTSSIPCTLYFRIAMFCIVSNTSYSAMAQTIFTDITEQSGIQHEFQVYEGMFGGGACVFDFNKDGYEDLFITGGMKEDVLYLNNGDGTFKNVYKGSGLEASSRYVTQGAVSADVNRDGWIDIFLTTITTEDSVKKIPRAENLLFLNNGNSTFRNVTKEYGLEELMSFSTGACFGDFNKDGFPDIYVANYFIEYEGTLAAINDATIVNANQTAKGYLLKNNQGQSFTNVYSQYGLDHRGFGWGATFTDFDNDSDADILVNHDFGYKAIPNVLLVNQFPENNFKSVGKAIKMDLKMNAMGTAVGDYNNDGLLDYYITNIRFNQFMVNKGISKPFAEMSKELGVDFVSISWGANFADFDNDSDLDLFVANGDLNPNDVPLADYYFENDKGMFTDQAARVGLNDYGIGRGSVVFDMENDGDLDILVVNQKPVLNYPVSSKTRLYRNDSTSGNWIKVVLQGIDSDLQGLGSRVEVVIGKLKMIREIDGGSSHLSQNSTIAHFGLGPAKAVDSLIVKWIGGKRQVFLNPKINSIIKVTETVEEKSNSKMIWGVMMVIPLIIFFFYKSIKNRMRNRKQSSILED